jgi:hypothetical protein
VRACAPQSFRNRTLAAVASLLLAACGQQAAAPPPPPSPSPTPPGLSIDPSQKTFRFPDARTGTTLRFGVQLVNTDPVNPYGSLRLALALQAAGGLDQQDVVVEAGPGPGCVLRTVGPVASPSDYPGSWGVEFDVDPGGGAVFAVAPGATRGPVCVQLTVVRPGASGLALEGVFFVYQDDSPSDGRFNAGETLRSRPLAEPMDLDIRFLGGQP